MPTSFNNSLTKCTPWTNAEQHISNSLAHSVCVPKKEFRDGLQDAFPQLIFGPCFTQNLLQAWNATPQFILVIPAHKKTAINLAEVPEVVASFEQLRCCTQILCGNTVSIKLDTLSGASLINESYKSVVGYHKEPLVINLHLFKGAGNCRTSMWNLPSLTSYSIFDFYRTPWYRSLLSPPNHSSPSAVRTCRCARSTRDGRRRRAAPWPSWKGETLLLSQIINSAADVYY